MSKIEHVIVLMMENRSFDHMLGFLEHPKATFDGLTGNESCPDKHGNAVLVSKDARYEIKSPDHTYAGAMEQLCGNNVSKPYNVTNKGFVTSYEKKAPGRGHEVMRCFDPDMIPVLSTLALEFAVCCRWFCSVPGETWPNREFAHCATSRGRADISDIHYHSSQRTIFDQLQDAGKTWRIYHEDTPHTWAFMSLWDTPAKRSLFRPMKDLAKHIRNDDLAHYSFIEPDYGLTFDLNGWGNSQHPGQAHTRNEFLAGERMIGDVYEALRSTPEVFEKTLFLITYDEHGGFYDHVAPPTTVSPDGKKWKGEFAFDLLGPRVPTVIVSPWIPRHTVDMTLYDHTSIIQTVRSLFAPGAPLTNRDRQALVFRELVSLDKPRRGSDLPKIHALTNEEGVALEKKLNLSPNVGVDSSDGIDAFHKAMASLTASVGDVLAAETGDESTLVSLEDGASAARTVTERFRSSAEEIG